MDIIFCVLFCVSGRTIDSEVALAAGAVRKKASETG